MNCLFSYGQALVTFVTAALGFSLPVEIETVSGEKLAGEWQAATKDAIRVKTTDGIKEVLVDKLVAMRPVDAPEPGTPPTSLVSIVTGSQVRVQDFSLADGKFLLEPRRQSTIQLPVQQIRSVRFRLGNAKTDPQWLGLLEADNRRDVMVIRRPGEQLDPIEGVVLGLDNETLQFELDGEKISAPVDRLEGVILRSTTTTASVKVRVEDKYGSVFAGLRLEPSTASDRIELLLGDDVRHSIPLEHLKSVTWASGRQMLARTTAANSEVTPYLQTKIDSELFEAWFGPRSDNDDLIATAGGSAEFRVDPGFQTLAGSVVRDTDVNSGMAVVRILIDGNVAWEQSVSGDKPKGFRVNIANARRVRLEVVAGSDGDVGDRVRFLNPRFLK
ncbi:MAG: NPCBM/NEW2 domain-containing protein [Planctomycetota bacterium]